jgi:hypothetical protein
VRQQGRALCFSVLTASSTCRTRRDSGARTSIHINWQAPPQGNKQQIKQAILGSSFSVECAQCGERCDLREEGSGSQYGGTAVAHQRVPIRNVCQCIDSARHNSLGCTYSVHVQRIRTSKLFISLPIDRRCPKYQSFCMKSLHLSPNKRFDIGV